MGLRGTPAGDGTGSRPYWEKGLGPAASYCLTMPYGKGKRKSRRVGASNFAQVTKPSDPAGPLSEWPYWIDANKVRGYCRSQHNTGTAPISAAQWTGSQAGLSFRHSRP